MLSSNLITSALAAHNPPPHIYIGYSGGVDSHVLLHLCAALPSLKPKITAVYIHHGLQAEAESWGKHCEITAQALAINFTMQRVHAHAKLGESPEEAARNARYHALKSLMGRDDVLLIGQHREDQLETVLLQLFRGSGLRGLSGMPASMTFGVGMLLRPLLNIPKQALDDYAKSQALQWIEDPSNQCSDYDRNFLRNNIVPALKQRWPALDKTVARSARHCADAALIIAEVADELMPTVFNTDDNTLDINELKTHLPYRQTLLIRQWFQCLGLKMPTQHSIGRLQAEVLAAREDSDPLVSAPGYCIRRYRNKLYCLPPDEPRTLLNTRWVKGQTSLAITRQLTLSCQPSSTGILREIWNNASIEISWRNGGEKIRLPKRYGRHTLKKLFQEAGIPPWERELIPLIYLDGKLAAIGERWISAEFYHEKTDECLMLSNVYDTHSAT